MSRNIETMIAVSEVRANNVVKACHGAEERVDHLNKCTRMILSRVALLKIVLGEPVNGSR